MRLLGPNEVAAIRRDRTALEKGKGGVAESIGECIERRCGEPLRHMMRKLLKEVCQVGSGSLNRLLVQGGKKNEYAMFVDKVTQPSLQGLEQLSTFYSRLDLATCSDVIRLFGELCEDKVLQGLDSSWKEYEDEKGKLRRGPTFLKLGDDKWRRIPVALKIVHVYPFNPKHEPNRLHPAPEEGKGKRVASLTNGKKVEVPESIKTNDIVRVWEDTMEYIDLVPPGKDPSTMPLPKKDSERDEADHVQFGHRDRTEVKKSKLGEILPGTERYQLGDQSVIGNLDFTFGAEMKGADVSGTTTDSIFAIRHASKEPDLWDDRFSGHLPLLMLLPIATMVPAGHHSLMECSYPLSREKYISYHIGYYDTLVPLNCTGEDRKALEANLALFKVEADQMHTLIYQNDQRQEAGLLMEGNEEIEEFKKLAKLLSAYGWCSAGKLGRQSLANILEIYSPYLLKKYPGHLKLVPKTVPEAVEGRRRGRFTPDEKQRMEELLKGV